MNYIVACNGSAEQIIFADHTKSGIVPGGAGFYALTGIKLWCDNVMMCAGLGKDYPEQIGQWLERNNIDLRGFNVRDEKTPINVCVYKNEADWYSYTEYGNEHYDSLDCFPEKDHLCDFLDRTKGVYVFRNDDTTFWNQIIPLREKFGFKLMWEIKATIAIPEKLASLERLLRHVDAFSINRPEAFSLFGVGRDKDVIEKLRSFGLPLIVYRVGEEGLYILLNGDCLFAPSFQQYEVVDVTGCGNTSTAAALYAFCEGEPIEMIAAMANVASSHTLRYLGPMELTEENRKVARRQALELARQFKKGEKR